MQSKKVGFTIGKFAPLHNGHQYLIETALKEMDEFIIVIYETDKIKVPVEQRAKWIQILYPKAKIVYAYNPPMQYGLDEQSVKIQMEYLQKHIGQFPVTHFYNSELYGTKVAEYLNIVDRKVDTARAKFPVSATAIRTEMEKYKGSLPGFVYKDCMLLGK